MGIIGIEMEPIIYKFTIELTVQSIEKDGERYLERLMRYFHDCGFRILNGKWENKYVLYDRLGVRCNENCIWVKIKIEHKTSNTHNPDDYIDKYLKRKVYNIYDHFKDYLYNNSDKLDYIYWLNCDYTSYTRSMEDIFK